jgi:serine/threonine protein kinase
MQNYLVVYEMICGRPPYKASNHVELLRKIDRAVGGVRFPGDDAASGRASVLISPSPATASPKHHSPIPALIAGSLGSSPRFSSGSLQTNAIPVSEDIKDLVRRLLKRNPIERMSFEEFFLHAAVRDARPTVAVANSLLENVSNAANNIKTVDDPQTPLNRSLSKQKDNALIFNSDVNVGGSLGRALLKPGSNSSYSNEIMNIEVPFPEYK